MPARLDGATYNRTVDNGMWKGASAGYRAVHTRLWQQSGSASTFKCTCCDRPASEWAYLGNAPDEQVSPEGYLFTTDLGYYVPMSHSCHMTFDNTRR